METMKTAHGDFLCERFTEKYKNRKAWVPEDIREVKSFIPGTIIEVFVKSGDNVKKGDKLLSFNAMKMLNLIEAEFDGVIKNVHISTGDSISKGIVMIEFK